MRSAGCSVSEPEYSLRRSTHLLCAAAMPCTAGAALPAHKDYLGSLMGLELRREALGDIVLPEDQPGTAYVFALEPAAQLICRELFQVGHTELTTELLTLVRGAAVSAGGARDAQCNGIVPAAGRCD